MKRNKQRHVGFTLVELLVVITIIGMLMALLLPAVNAAVEQARNITCKNNLRNLATACVNFESSKGRFPGYREWVPGSVDPSNQNRPFIRGWTVAILPQLDHHDWYETFATQIGSSGQDVAFASELLVCPSNPPTTGLGGWSGFCINAGYWYTNSAGTTPTANGKPDDGTLESPADGIAHDAALVAPSGELLVGAGTAMDAVMDGASYTILVSENVAQTQGAKKTWFVAQPLKFDTTMVWHLRDIDTTNDPKKVRPINARGDYPSLQQVPLDRNSARPSSFHMGGVNIAFCDQRVIFLRQTINYRVYQHLMTPNGRESRMDPNVVSVPLTDQEYQ